VKLISLTFAIVICSFFCRAYAQSEKSFIVVGSILDSTSLKPVPHVIVSIKPTNGVNENYLTTDTGTFRFDRVSEGTFTIAISFLGYKKISYSFKTSSSTNNIVNIGKLLIVPMVHQVGEVKIVSKIPLVTQEPDKLVYNVSADPESKFQNMLEVLRKVPLISITAQDEVQVKGNTNFKILINGRNSSLVAGSPKDVFRVIPAAMVEKIEVITLPPAKYDAEGLGGIINVITIKKRFQGYLGGLNANYGILNSSIGGQINLKFGKVGVSLFTGNFKEYPPKSTVFNKTTSMADNGYMLTQNGFSKTRSNISSGNIRLNYDIDSLNLISMGLNGRTGYNKSDNDLDTHVSRLTSEQTYNLQSANKSSIGGLGFDANYELGFKKNKKQLLTASYSYNYSSKNQELNNNSVSPIATLSSQNNRSFIKEETGQLDYVQPVKNTDISVGVKIIHRDNKSDYVSILQDSLGKQYWDPLNSNAYLYVQNIYSAYNSYQFKLRKWSIYAGGRIEKTTNNAQFNTAEGNFKSSYFNAVPSIALQKTFTNNSIRIGYTQRIQRPTIWQLNPFVDKSDPTFYYSGNPKLKPVQNHNFLIGYDWSGKGYVNTELSYSFANNTIERAITLRSDTLSASSYFNIGRSKNISLNISLKYPLTTKLSLNLNGLVSFVKIKGVIDGRNYNNNGTQGNGYAYLTYQFKEGWRVSANAGFYSPVILLQGSSSSYKYTSLSGSRAFLHNKLYISASIVNPFQTYRLTQNRITAGLLDQTFRTYNYSRNFTVAVSYNFGKMDGAPIKRNKKKIENDDTIESSTNEKGKP